MFTCVGFLLAAIDFGGLTFVAGGFKSFVSAGLIPFTLLVGTLFTVLLVYFPFIGFGLVTTFAAGYFLSVFGSLTSLELPIYFFPDKGVFVLSTLVNGCLSGTFIYFFTPTGCFGSTLGLVVTGLPTPGLS